MPAKPLTDEARARKNERLRAARAAKRANGDKPAPLKPRASFAPPAPKLAEREAKARASARVKARKRAKKRGNVKRKRTTRNWDTFVADAVAKGTRSVKLTNDNVARVMAWRLRQVYSGIKTTTNGATLTVRRAR
jgi:hypothetical protein